MTTLLITNDLGPRIGGIESFNELLCDWLGDLGEVVVLTSPQDDAAPYDAQLDYRVIRAPHCRSLSGGGRSRQPVLLPGPRTTALATELVRHHGIDRVIISAAAPLGLLTDSLRGAGVGRIIAISHGHEAVWAKLPGARRVLRRIVGGVDRFCVISGWTRERISAALAPDQRAKLITLAPPVRPEFFAAAPSRTGHVRCIAAARLIPQKGFDTVLRAWRRLGDHAPPLTIAGAGPLAERLAGEAAGLSMIDFVGPVARRSMPDLIAAHDLFVLPVRHQLGGLLQEGFGLGFAEAGAAGLAAIGTRTGGVPEIVVSGHTGWLIDPGDADALAAYVAAAKADPRGCAAMGERAREHARRFDGTEQREILLDALA